MTPAETRGPAREQAICEAALELLVEVGYDKLTMDAVATRARASKATIYRHWPGKAELVQEALRCRATPAELPHDTGSLRGDLLAMFSAVPTDENGQDSKLLVGVLRAGHDAPELRDCVFQQVVEHKRGVIDALVTRARARGEVVRPDATDVVQEIVPALAFFRLAVEGRPLDGEFAQHVVDDIVLPLVQRVGAASVAPA